MRVNVILFTVFWFVNHSYSETTFGPEIEFSSKKYWKGIACEGVKRIGIAGAYGTIIYGVAASEMDSDKYKVVAASAAATAACLVLRNTITNSVGSNYLDEINSDLASKSPMAQREWVQDGKAQLRALKVTYSDGTVIVFSQDPSVIEVKVPRITSRQAQQKQDFLQDEIWNRLERIGLKVPTTDGPWNGGHIHIGIDSGLDGSPKNLKKFVFDYAQHNELSSGVLGRDALGTERWNYSANVRQLNLESNYEKLVSFGKEMDALEAVGKKLDQQVLQEIVKKYPGLFKKGSELSIRPELGTVELRGARSPKSADELARITEIYDARTQYTNGLDDVSLPKKGEFQPARTPAQKAERYREYIEEPGLDYERYKTLAPEKFQEPNPAALSIPNTPQGRCILEKLNALR